LAPSPADAARRQRGSGVAAASSSSAEERETGARARAHMKGRPLLSSVGSGSGSVAWSDAMNLMRAIEEPCFRGQRNKRIFAIEIYNRRLPRFTYFFYSYVRSPPANVGK